MRSLIAVILLSAHLLTIGVCCGAFNNTAGTEEQLIKQLYQSKTRKDLVELKIPVHMPGVSAWVEYENILGEIKLKNADYIYVSMKMSSDTMSLVCINNSKRSHVYNANIIDAKDISDVPVGKKAHNTSSRKILDTQYNSQPFQYHFNDITIHVNECVCRGYLKLINPFLETCGQPPDHCC